jgi:ABC-type transporter MlaC component
MDWQLGISDGRYKILDVSIDGVSAAMSRRSQGPRSLPRSPPPGHPIIAE